ncbi:MAG: hypothetical protein N2B57_08095 [Planctomycetales bacterium]
MGWRFGGLLKLSSNDNVGKYDWVDSHFTVAIIFVRLERMRFGQ